MLSCTKEANSVKTGAISAITVVNAMGSANPFIVDLYGANSVAVYYATTRQIGYGSYYDYSIPSGNMPLTIYQTTDTLHPVYKNTVNLQPDAIYSLFLSGLDVANPDTLLIQDHPPYHSIADSTVGVRFVNLSQDSNPISVNIQGTANGSEVSSLSYKSITDFKSYPATINIAQYTFEIRDASSGNLLTTYTYNVAPFQNITIAVIGEEDPLSTVPISTMQINNY